MTASQVKSQLKKSGIVANVENLGGNKFSIELKNTIFNRAAVKRAGFDLCRAELSDLDGRYIYIKA